MPKDELVYVGHMLDKAHERYLWFVKDRQDYDRDSALRFSAHASHQVIGEAARRVSVQFVNGIAKFRGRPSPHAE